MRLLSALQSMRLCAGKDTPASRRNKNNSKETTQGARAMQISLFVTQRLHRIEPGSPSRRIEARHQAYHEGKQNGEGNQPPGHGPEVFRRKTLPLQINIGSQVDHLADGPAQR